MAKCIEVARKLFKAYTEKEIVRTKCPVDIFEGAEITCKTKPMRTDICTECWNQPAGEITPGYRK